MVTIVRDNRKLQTAIGNSLWGSTKIFSPPLGATATSPLDLVRVSVDDDTAAAFTLTLNDDEENVNVGDRKVDIFFGNEGHQAKISALDFPRGRMITVPGSYVRVAAWVENANPAGTPRPQYKLGAHASYYPARSGSFRIIGTLSISGAPAAPNNFKDIQIPRFCRAIQIEESTSTTYNQMRIGIRIQSGLTISEYQTIPPVGLPYFRNIPANAVVYRVYNDGPNASVYIYELEMDF